MKKELTRLHIEVTEEKSSAYNVNVTITVGVAKDAKQPVAVRWEVKGADGKLRGTVSQKADVPEGSLDGAWGTTAEQVAASAATGILKLLWD
jgi:hypothetical protein